MNDELSDPLRRSNHAAAIFQEITTNFFASLQIIGNSEWDRLIYMLLDPQYRKADIRYKVIMNFLSGLDPNLALVVAEINNERDYYNATYVSGKDLTYESRFLTSFTSILKSQGWVTGEQIKARDLPYLIERAMARDLVEMREAAMRVLRTIQPEQEAEFLDRVRPMLERGMSIGDIANEIGISGQSLWRFVDKHQLITPEIWAKMESARGAKISQTKIAEQPLQPSLGHCLLVGRYLKAGYSYSLLVIALAEKYNIKVSTKSLSRWVKAHNLEIIEAVNSLSVQEIEASTTELIEEMPNYQSNFSARNFTEEHLAVIRAGVEAKLTIPEIRDSLLQKFGIRIGIHNLYLYIVRHFQSES